MDPLLFARINAFQNLQNQRSNEANLQQLQANESLLRANAKASEANATELRKLRQQLNEEASKPQCPHCGGPTEQDFDRCKNCSQEVIWCGHFVGKLGQELQLAFALQQYQIAEQEKQQRKAEIARINAEQKRLDKFVKDWEANRGAWVEYDRRPWTDVGSLFIFIGLVVMPIIGFWVVWHLNPNTVYNHAGNFKMGTPLFTRFYFGLRGFGGFILHGVCLAIAFFQCVKAKPKSPRDLESVENPVPIKPERVLHQCPSCRETIDLNSFDTGSTVRCFTCHARITVP
jgi:hypothetical protein